MGDDNANQKKRKSKWTTSYSNMTSKAAQKRLGLRISTLQAIPVDIMLANVQHTLGGEGLAAIQKCKETVYHRIVEYLDIENYPTEADPDFKEANVNDLVYGIISPILFDFRRSTGRNGVKLHREKVIVSTDSETGGTEEFVVVDLISVEEEVFVFIIEAKRDSLGQAMKQCLLAMKDTRDINGSGEVYGFVTTGEAWRMLRYDGTYIELTEKIDVMFDTMSRNNERWMKDYSVLVDCMFVALNNGGKGNTNTIMHGDPLSEAKEGA